MCKTYINFRLDMSGKTRKKQTIYSQFIIKHNIFVYIFQTQSKTAQTTHYKMHTTNV